MSKFFGKLFTGLAIGVGIGLALYVLGFIIELFNCACHIVTCNCEGNDALPFMWNGIAFRNCMIFCTAGGGIVGGFYGMILGIQERSARLAAERAERDRNALEQRQKYAQELKKESQGVLSSVYNIQTQAKKFEQEPTYSACDNQKAGWTLLKNAYHINEDLKRITEEIEN